MKYYELALSILITFSYSLNVEAFNTDLEESCSKKLNENSSKVYRPQFASFEIRSLKESKIISVFKPKHIAYVMSKDGATKCPGMRSIKGPFHSIVSFSTTHLKALEWAGVLDALKGLSGIDNVYSKSINTKIKKGKIKGVGFPPSPEEVVKLKPDAVFSYPSPEFDKMWQDKLGLFKISYIPINENLEQNPLGRVEWAIFIASFFDREDIVAKKVAGIIDNYKNLKQKVSGEKNKVLVGSFFGGQWSSPSSSSDFVKILQDAGGDYILKDIDNERAKRLDFEEVYKHIKTVDIWIPNSNFSSLSEAYREDVRYKMIGPNVKKIFNFSNRKNEHGGNDYWETGVMRPDLVLKDLVYILHPLLLPKYKLIWYHQIK